MQAADQPLAETMLARARELEPDRGGMLDLLEYCAADASHDEARLMEVRARFEHRRDLPSLLSRMISNERLGRHLQDGHFDEAATCARRLLSIEENGAAEMVPQVRGLPRSTTG